MTEIIDDPTDTLGRFLTPTECAATATTIYRRTWHTFGMIRDNGTTLPAMRGQVLASIGKLCTLAQAHVRYAFSVSSSSRVVFVLWGTDVLGTYRIAEPWTWTSAAYIAKYDPTRHGAFFLMKGARANGVYTSALPPLLYPAGTCTVQTFDASWRARHPKPQQVALADAPADAPAEPQPDADIARYRMERDKRTPSAAIAISEALQEIAAANESIGARHYRPTPRARDVASDVAGDDSLNASQSL